MKLNLIALASLVALTAAQSTDSTSEAATGTTAAPTTTVSLTPQQSCAKKWQWHPADTDRYAACQSSCYSSHFFPITATGNSGASKTDASDSSATTTGKGSSSTDSSESSGSRSSGSKASGTGTSTGTAATSSETNAASVAKIQLGVSAAGIAGVAFGIWAL
ncbi:hypothetical protein ANOM_008538 [Aspergillus nomiae NRRL 13137]|uniref:GPI anchored protein n=1 Tax=Aspergillus nomiae NRRL (strain ATCC 15546 / NRRL 13137 / CBS 260.88 / M93) TaxID=1509407 RepID=A0A0L1IV29_ASPN3|nr:uncharacterized protein ANOM_008538 [Aspergillus nomiae NRRL 13137]KNG83275.1 hypothetical protein ANOM_008538 [Aspergillus nomiae NRRL 13137]